MGAAGGVGRVCAAAVALGVGAAIASNAPAAWADSGSSSSSSASSSSGKSARTGGAAKRVKASTTASARATVTAAKRPAAATLRPRTLPAGDPATPVTSALLAWTRREQATATTARQVAAQQVTPVEAVENVVADVDRWLRTYVNFQPWVDGTAWLPAPLKPVLFNHTPVASPMQVQVNLAGGVTSAAIPFTAYDPDGDPIRYSVPVKGMPGGPEHGIVTVDNTAGTFTYTPDENYTGTDTFAFVADDETTIHVHAWDNLLNAAFGIFGTSLAGGHTDTATVTIFNGVPVAPITGQFSMLTYNVAGLPIGLTDATFPRITSNLQIGSLLNGFDIVNVQADVSFHPFLIANTAFPDQTAPSVPTWLWPAGLPFSDGLNTFSAYDIESLTRQGWSGCELVCIAPKGFTYSRIHIPGGSSIDLYNVHVNDGDEFTDTDLAQLSTFIAATSVGRAVIVAGDFSQLYSGTGQSLTEFATANGLTDAWVQVEYNGITPTDAPGCAYADNCEQPDKIFYRSATALDPGDPASSPVRLTAVGYTNEGLNFLNGSGQDLSNHRPQSVTFSYTVAAVGPQNVDLANWMGDLPELSDLPLTQLPIPGTHDSGSYGITAASPWALTGVADFGILTQLPDFIVKPIAAAWARTAGKDLYGQFSDGIRYVDLRLTNEPDGQIYIEHGLRGSTIDEVLDDISRFAHEHPREVLLVDMARFTNFDAASHDILLDKIYATLGDRLAPRSLGTAASLGDLWAIDKNVILLYGNSSIVTADPDLWYRGSIYQPWPNVQSVPPLLEANRDSLNNRFPWLIWGLSGQTTPDTSTIVAGILTLGPTSNRELLFDVHPALQQWIRGEFKSNVNLVTTDWHHDLWPADSSYARDVIGAVYETKASRLV
ncbi:Ig-like domain-containing protein [Mycobacterium sp. M26]|uniref:Ig-like domain-containing protein n=1 Tax=Mycobacterium sp. M26 TaxID=1762962 RepID=UPI0012E3BCD7|nr:Ig-like domain-containing protein [Mycobacterium sp. M26]